MTQETPPQATDLNTYGFVLPTPEESLSEAKRRLALTLRRSELAWIVGENYDVAKSAWYLDVVRQGATGAWVRQRSRYDAQAEVLYYLGETPLSAQEFR